MITKIKKPSNRGGRKLIALTDILPYLPQEDCFFDCRHWVYDTTDGVLPFSLTTRISGNCQQYLKIRVKNDRGQGTRKDD